MTMASMMGFVRPLTPVSSSASTTMSDAGSFDSSNTQAALKTALHVIRTERDALTALEDLYETDAVAQNGFTNAVDVLANAVRLGGKLMICGCGKSGKIGQKIVATMNSFGIHSVFLHPTEALHGDLGLIGEVSAPSPAPRAATDLTFFTERHDSHHHFLRQDTGDPCPSAIFTSIAPTDSAYLSP